MSSMTTHTTMAAVYRKALKNLAPGDPVFRQPTLSRLRNGRAGFFRQIAEPYRHHAQIYMLNTGESPRHPDVTGTPTVLFYKEGKLLKKLKGIGTRETLEENFKKSTSASSGPNRLPANPATTCRGCRKTFSTLCTAPRARGGC